MGGKQMEGNAEQRRRKAREVRREGKAPSEVGATLGASQQHKDSDRSMSHQERQELKREGKHEVLHGHGDSKVRPRSRDD
ncbi:MAG TPA: hypothetical protein VHG28_01470 [Longimicrobiaceae bacterium]|nr:hypothetical protein [Longimicrobiaceae bacterium]